MNSPHVLIGLWRRVPLGNAARIIGVKSLSSPGRLKVSERYPPPKTFDTSVERRNRQRDRHDLRGTPNFGDAQRPTCHDLSKVEAAGYLPETFSRPG